MRQHRSPWTRALVVAACFTALSACEENPTAPDARISFNPVLSCPTLAGSFFAPTIVVFRDGPGAGFVTFTGSPALLLGFADGRFTSNVFASGMPQITNVGSFSISGGYVIFGERPIVPRLGVASQRFNCQLTGNRLFLANDAALFDFGSGRFERARVRLELTRR